MYAKRPCANFITLAEALINKSNDQAREVLAEGLKVIPNQSIPYDLAGSHRNFCWKSLSIIPLKLGMKGEKNQENGNGRRYR